MNEKSSENLEVFGSEYLARNPWMGDTHCTVECTKRIYASSAWICTDTSPIASGVFGTTFRGERLAAGHNWRRSLLRRLLRIGRDFGCSEVQTLNNAHRASSILPNNQAGIFNKNGLNFLFFNFLIDTFSRIFSRQAPSSTN